MRTRVLLICEAAYPARHIMQRDEHLADVFLPDQPFVLLHLISDKRSEVRNGFSVLHCVSYAAIVISPIIIVAHDAFFKVLLGCALSCLMPESCVVSKALTTVSNAPCTHHITNRCMHGPAMC